MILVIYWHPTQGSIESIYHALHSAVPGSISRHGRCDYYMRTHQASQTTGASSGISSSISMSGTFHKISTSTKFLDALRTTSRLTAECSMQSSGVAEECLWFMSIEEINQHSLKIACSARLKLSHAILCLGFPSIPAGMVQKDIVIDVVEKIARVRKIHCGFSELQQPEHSDYGLLYSDDSIVPASKQFVVEDAIWRRHDHQNDCRMPNLRWLNIVGSDFTDKVDADFFDNFKNWKHVDLLGRYAGHTGGAVRLPDSTSVFWLANSAREFHSRLAARTGLDLELFCWTWRQLHQRNVLI